MNCRICQSKNTAIWSRCKDYEYVTSNDEYTYYECKDCTTLFIHPMPVDKLDLIYPSNYYSFKDIKKNLAVQVKEYLDKREFKKVLSKIKGDKISVLDVGGGSGWLLNIIKQIDSRVEFTQVVDIDSNAKRIAEENGHQYYHGTIETFETNKQFDLILMLNLIEHISDPQTSLIKMEEMLKSGGQILIKTPNIDSLDAKAYKDDYWGGLHCPRHWILFSEKSFKLMVEKTNLSLDSVEYTQGASFWAWGLLIKWQKKGWTKITRERPVVYHPLIPILHIVYAAFDFSRLLLGQKASQMVINLEKKTPVHKKQQNHPKLLATAETE